ncbi:mucin-4, partial [Biomphalaria glabrata]
MYTQGPLVISYTGTHTALPATQNTYTYYHRQCKSGSQVQQALYSYGTDVGDNVISQESSTLSPMVLFSSGLPFGSQVHKYFHVSINGAATFGAPSTLFAPNPNIAKSLSQNVFAPFWSEVDPFYNNSRVYYHLYERLRVKGTYFYSPQLDNILNRATNEVKEYFTFGTGNFNATTVIVLTWRNVKPLAWYSLLCKNNQYSSSAGRYCGDQTEVNTFQAIIASNGTTSYAISMYQKGGMKWEFVPNRNIYVGHVSDKALKDYKLTFSRKTVSLGSDIGTAGREGTYIDIVGASENSAQNCLDFYYKNLYLVSNTQFQNNIRSLLKCPCSLERLDYQWTLVEKRSNDNIYCYAISSIYKRRELSNNSLNRLCCYQYKNPTSNSWEATQQAARESFYVSGVADSGNILTESPFPENRRQSLEKDLTPKIWCCQESDLCELYSRVRPDPGCTLDSPFISASSFGDPHITTLDDNEYTLNGLAEYSMLNVPGKFMMQ